MSSTQASQGKSVLVINRGRLAIALPQAPDWWTSVAPRILNAPDAAAALALLQSEPVDILIYRREPGDMPWPDLMKHARDRFPRMARVLIASPTDGASHSDLLWLTHCFLPSSATPAQLKAALARVFALQELLANAGLSDLLSRIERLPSQGSVWARLIAESNKPNVAPSDLARVIENDPVATSKVLQLVNSVYFGLGQPVSSIHQATSYMGIALVRSLAMNAQLHTLFETTLSKALTQIGDLQHHSALVGRLAKQILGGREGDTAMAAGLIHDIGTLALLLGIPRYDTERQRPTAVTPDDLHGVDHAALGAHIARLWALPEEVCDVLAFSHCPSNAANVEVGVLMAVHVADALVTSLTSAEALVIDREYLRQLGKLDQLSAWTTMARRLIAPPMRVMAS